MSTTVQRKLTTILAADAEGYSRAMDADEVSTLGALRAARAVFSRFIERHHGRIVNTAGDGLIAEFPSVVEAVQCAIEVQHELGGSSNNARNELRFRIGIHLGDVMIDGSDLLGEGVNLAARLESMAEAGGILISQQVYDQVQHKLSVGFEYIGQKRPRNFAEDVPVYRLSLGKGQRGTVDSAPDFRPERNREPEEPASEDFRTRTIRHAKLLGVFCLVLFVVNAVTAETIWAHWPGLALVTLFALRAAPLCARGWFNIQYVRGVVIVGALALVNLFTWSGYLWVIWPAGVLVTIELIRRLGNRSR